MTDMYDEPKAYDGKLKAYPHEELGVEVGWIKHKKIGTVYRHSIIHLAYDTLPFFFCPTYIYCIARSRLGSLEVHPGHRTACQGA